MSELAAACSQIVAAIRQILAHRSPIVVALDGGSGAGKSTLAAMLEQEIESVVIPLDDFFSATIPDWEWDTRSIPERVRDVFDWARLRTDALEPLRAGRPARWFPFDFASGIRPDGTYGLSPHAVEKQPAKVIILEGAYSSSPEIADLIDLAVLVDVPVAERRQRLDRRESDQRFLKRWHTLWDGVEDYYFSEVRPKSAFDLVVRG